MLFLAEKHAEYIQRVSADRTSLEYVLTDYMRMSGVYWGVTSMALLGKLEEMEKEELVNWVVSCQHPCGGFGGSEDHDPHMLYTLSAVQILAVFDSLERIDGDAACRYVAGLQRTEDGSFAGDEWGEIDTRFSYCGLALLAIFGRLDLVDVSLAAKFVDSCKNFDGGYGAVPGAESHAGQVFCCVGALAIAGEIKLVNRKLLGWWLAERQCDSGGLNGRPEKQADVCYSWWILSSLCMLGCRHWIDTDKLTSFILDCQDPDGGGIADRPGNVSDVFHTFFGIGGLSLLKFFDGTDHLPIDPVFALPVDVTQRLQLTPTVFEDDGTLTLFSSS